MKHTCVFGGKLSVAGVAHFGAKHSGCFVPLGSVSQRFRNFSGPFRVLKLSLYIYLRNDEVLSHQSNPLGFPYNKSMLKDQLFKTSRLKFDNWLFWPEKFSGLYRNRPLVTLQMRSCLLAGKHFCTGARLPLPNGKNPTCRVDNAKNVSTEFHF